jgi:lipid II:glycine glycyltransferase (peptidoglycan interpeptide bridge formation enzyme)
VNIKEKIDKDQWDKFVSSEKPDTFLHSWNWGEFNRMMGDKIFRLAIFDDNDNDLAGVALIIKISAKRGKFLFCPHGPIIKSSKFKVQSSKFWNAFLNYLNKLAVKENVDFVRISSLLENNKENTEIFKSAGFRDAPIHMIHPELSWILDISKTEEEILSGMRKTTRNLIRRAEKDAVRVSESRDAKDIGKFCELHSKTVSRHGFVPFSESYLKNQFAAFIRDDQISIFFAEHNNQVLSSAIIMARLWRQKFPLRICFYGKRSYRQKNAIVKSLIFGA